MQIGLNAINGAEKTLFTLYEWESESKNRDWKLKLR